MAIEWHGEQRLEEAEQEMARRLLRAAVWFTQQHQQRVGVSTPGQRSKVGQYPRKVTGLGQANILHAPATVQEIVNGELKVRIGARATSLVAGLPHLVFLERHRNRLGFRQSIKDLRELTAEFLKE